MDDIDAFQTTLSALVGKRVEVVFAIGANPDPSKEEAAQTEALKQRVLRNPPPSGTHVRLTTRDPGPTDVLVGECIECTLEWMVVHGEGASGPTVIPWRRVVMFGELSIGEPSRWRREGEDTNDD